MVRFGAKSLLLVLIAGPRFCSGPHASSTLARWVTQMSFPPRPPGRLETKYRLNPSFEIDGCCSLDAELTTGPRFAGAPHGPYRGCSSAAASAAKRHAAPGPTGLSSALHA